MKTIGTSDFLLFAMVLATDSERIRPMKVWYHLGKLVGRNEVGCMPKMQELSTAAELMLIINDSYWNTGECRV
jgi:hypothetical protein